MRHIIEKQESTNRTPLRNMKCQKIGTKKKKKKEGKSPCTYNRYIEPAIGNLQSLLAFSVMKLSQSSISMQKKSKLHSSSTIHLLPNAPAYHTNEGVPSSLPCRFSSPFPTESPGLENVKPSPNSITRIECSTKRASQNYLNINMNNKIQKSKPHALGEVDGDEKIISWNPIVFVFSDMEH